MTSSSTNVRKFLIEHLSFFPGLSEHLDKLLTVLTPGEIIIICFTFPRESLILDQLSPETLKEIIDNIKDENEKIIKRQKDDQFDQYFYEYIDRELESLSDSEDDS